MSRTRARQLRDGDLRSGIRPQLQRALVDELRGVRGAGVVVDVADGRLLAAAGSGGVSPWRSLQPPGSTLKAVLSAGALSAETVTAATPLNGDDGPGGVQNAQGRRYGPLTLERALALSSNTVFADVAVRYGAANLDDLLRRTGFDRRARAGDLRGLVAVSDGPSLAETGTHGAGSEANFVDEQGRFRDPDRRARTTTFQLGQIALALATEGRRTDIGLTRPGPISLEGGVWNVKAGRQVRGMMSAVVRDGTATTARSARVAIAAKTGTMPTNDGRVALSLVGFAPAEDPQVAVALTAMSRSGRTAGEVLGPRLRRLLELESTP